MSDIFDNQILCNTCKKPMKKVVINKNGFNLRALRCEKCKETLIHPVDKEEYNNFIRLKEKEFNVKMRMVGNSYAVSIPREIVDFMQEQENIMNKMVRLCFNDANSLSLSFNAPHNPINNENSRVVKSREVKIIRNNKPVLHARQVYDSANPKNNKTQIIKNSEEQDE